eukprot:4269207-Alexandrium_andersonii.AAC.1
MLLNAPLPVEQVRLEVDARLELPLGIEERDEQRVEPIAGAGLVLQHESAPSAEPLALACRTA